MYKVPGVASFPPSHDGCEAVDSCVPQRVAAIHFPNLTQTHLGGLLALYCAGVFFLFGVCVCLCSSWWFQIFFYFIPIWGRFPIWLCNIFQMGWNHQPVVLELGRHREEKLLLAGKLHSSTSVESFEASKISVSDRSQFLALCIPPVKKKLVGGFKCCFIFTTTWGNDPIWLIFFNQVETTN